MKRIGDQKAAKKFRWPKTPPGPYVLFLHVSRLYPYLATSAINFPSRVPYRCATPPPGLDNLFFPEKRGHFLDKIK